MKSSIAIVLESLRAKIASCVEAKVFLGAPDDASPGLYILPIRFAESAGIRNAPKSRSGEMVEPGYVLHCLMTACPGNDYTALGAGIAFLSAGISPRLCIAFDVQV